MSKITVITPEYLDGTLVIDNHKVGVNIDNTTIQKDENGVISAKSVNAQYYISGESITVSRLVYLNEDGKVYQFNNTSLNLVDKVIGFTNHMAQPNIEVEIITKGICANFYGLEVGKKYYAGVDGAITSIPPVIGIQQLVGIAKSGSELSVQLQKSVIKI